MRSSKALCITLRIRKFFNEALSDEKLFPDFDHLLNASRCFSSLCFCVKNAHGFVASEEEEEKKLLFSFSVIILLQKKSLQ